MIKGLSNFSLDEPDAFTKDGLKPELSGVIPVCFDSVRQSYVKSLC